MTEATIGLGSNIGDKQGNLDRAIAALAATPGIRLVARSSDWRTEPWGFADQDWFVNACIAVETSLAARALLERCLAVEEQLGRRREIRWGPRLIDLDILTFGDAVIDEPGLSVPHPHIGERAFALAPLAEIRPGLVIAGRTAAEHLAALDATGVVRLDRPVPTIAP